MLAVLPVLRLVCASTLQPLVKQSLESLTSVMLLCLTKLSLVPRLGVTYKWVERLASFLLPSLLGRSDLESSAMRSEQRQLQAQGGTWCLSRSTGAQREGHRAPSSLPCPEANEVQNYRVVLERFIGSSTVPDVVVMNGKILPRYVKRNFLLWHCSVSWNSFCMHFPWKTALKITSDA